MNTSDTQNTDTISRPFGYWIKAVDRLMAAEFASAFEGEHANRRDWRLLNVIDGTATARRPLNAHKLHGLLDRGWVVADGDGWLLTDDGRAAKDRLGGIVDDIRAKVTDAVSPDDLETTLASLEQIARAFGWDEETPLPRGRGRRHGFGHGFGRDFGPDRGFGPGFGPGRGFGRRHDRPFGRGRGFGPDHEHGFGSGHGEHADSHHGHPDDNDHDRSEHGHTEHGHGGHGHCGHGPSEHEHRHDDRGHGRDGHGGHGHRSHGRDGHGGHGHRAARAAQHAFERGFDAGYSRGRDA